MPVNSPSRKLSGLPLGSHPRSTPTASTRRRGVDRGAQHPTPGPLSHLWPSKVQHSYVRTRDQHTMLPAFCEPPRRDDVAGQAATGAGLAHDALTCACLQPEPSPEPCTYDLLPCPECASSSSPGGSTTCPAMLHHDPPTATNCGYWSYSRKTGCRPQCQPCIQIDHKPT